jgi:hypothetical protein
MDPMRRPVCRFSRGSVGITLMATLGYANPYE